MASARTRMQLRTLAVVTLVAALVAPAFNMLTSERSWENAAQGMIDGVLVAVVVVSYLFFIRDGVLRSFLRQRTFAWNLVFNGTVVLGLFLLMRGLGQLVTSGQIGRFTQSFIDEHLLYAIPFFIFVAFAIQFLVQMNRMVGTNVLGYFLAGTYHQPKEEERIFLFLDLESSTRLAEQLGSSRYYELLRRYVDDLSEPILATRGEIYQYAGDEVVITWRRDRGLANANCVRCYFAIEDAIRANASRYHDDFGVVPAFRGGLHGGQVIAGELGDLRQEIVFVGDILNTASRLEDYAREHKLRLVTSGALLAQLELPPGFQTRLEDEIQPRGKEETVPVYSLRREAAGKSAA